MSKTDAISQQWIVVDTPSANSRRGALTAYQMGDAGWTVFAGPTPCDLGANGVGTPADDSDTTPVGTFPLGQSFGRYPNPGTKLPYFQTTPEDWWDEDQDSDTYNTHVRSEDMPSDDAENLYENEDGDEEVAYRYAVLVDHNPECVPGRSCAIFLHVSDGDPTQGCVAIDEDDMASILAWLDPASVPRITIGVAAGPPPFRFG